MTQMRPMVTAIALGGLVAGTIDIGAAMLITGRDLIYILHAIASGLLGKASFDGGTAAAILGLGLQWAMSLIIAAIYGVAALKLPWLRRAWIAAGLAYGVVVFVVMNYVVVPLSAVGHAPHFTTASLLKNLAAMLLFGLIVAVFARAPSAAQTITQPG